MSMLLKDFYTNLAKYFRRSVIDSERLSPNTQSLLQAVKPVEYSQVKKDAPFAVDASVWLFGQLNEETTQSIFLSLKVSKKVQEVDIVLMPRVDLLAVSSGEAVGKPSKIVTPLVVQVKLNRLGQLSPANAPPFIPRQWLAPNQSDEAPFANVTELDAFISQHPYNANSWEELQDYCCRMLAHVLAQTTAHHPLDIEGNDASEPTEINTDNDANKVLPSLFEFSVLDDYQPRTDISLVLLEPPIKAGFHILKIYDAMIRDGHINGLFKNMFATTHCAPIAFNDLTHSKGDCVKHVGQMSAEFPLANKQRNAVHYINRMQTGESLAVNGPPGTGKTTLLRSVVADAWVRSAVEANEPPIIVAASSSNQAVTNILDSFSKIEETNIADSLKGRWLPHINAYGLYACGDNKANDKNPYAYFTKKGAGIMHTMETDISVPDMTETFLAQFNVYSAGEEVIKLDVACDTLHRELRQCVNLQAILPQALHECQSALKHCEETYGSQGELDIFILENTQKSLVLSQNIEASKSYLELFLVMWQKRSFFESLLSFLPFVKKRWGVQNELLASQLTLAIDGSADEQVRVAIDNSSRKLNEQLKQVTQVLELAKKDKLTLEKAQQGFSHALSIANIQTSQTELDFPALNNLIDTHLRFKAFKLASHYWEARWLQDMGKTPESPRTPTERLATYQRYAKLTPCFVSTFNMLPNFFEVSEKDGDSWKSTPMVDGADLLIVDEAGQALPHIAAASFVIAKKALLVGDIHQIEPVWSLSQGIDKANLSLDYLLDESLEYDNFWVNSELLASAGNLMKVAHRQTPYRQFKDLENGLYLTEHRRCYDSIIHYCNKLVYQGHLEALRGEADSNQVIPTMGFVEHESSSEQVGASRTNRAEAKFICQWIRSNAHLIAVGGSLENAVAVITPFAMQAKVIKSELSRIGLDNIKVGTVHTFQGAECDLILFSSVYGVNDSAGSKFYDRGNNMMNVAVSRAKNSFVVFGDRNVFGCGGDSSPSGLLRQYLSAIETNQAQQKTAELVYD